MSPARRAALGQLAGWASLALAGPSAQAQSPGAAPPPELAAEWPSAAPRLQGQARFRFFGLHIYDLRLWAPQPLRAATLSEQPLALELIYARGLEGGRIAQRSLDEMRRAGPLDEPTAQRWLAAMRGLFPDVAEADRITGVQVPGERARFHVNAKPAGEVREAEFARRFFGIWLAPHSSEPALRQQLLAGVAP
jgi:hypothetical protein